MNVVVILLTNSSARSSLIRLCYVDIAVRQRLLISVDINVGVIVQ